MNSGPVCSLCCKSSTNTSWVTNGSKKSSTSHSSTESKQKLPNLTPISINTVMSTHIKTVFSTLSSLVNCSSDASSSFKKNSESLNTLSSPSTKKYPKKNSFKKYTEKPQCVSRNTSLQSSKSKRTVQTNKHLKNPIKSFPRISSKCQKPYWPPPVTKVTEISYYMAISVQFSHKVNIKEVTFHIFGLCLTVSIALWLKSCSKIPIALDCKS